MHPAHDLALHVNPPRLVAVGVDWASGDPQPADREHSRAGSRPRSLRGGHAHRQRPRLPTGSWPAWARRNSGICSTWAGRPAPGPWRCCEPCPVLGRRSSICRTPSSRPRAARRQRVGRSRDSGARRFLRRPTARRRGLRLADAIIHQHSRQHNRELFAKVFAALERGGRVGVRDIVMDPSRTRPLFGRCLP